MAKLVSIWTDSVVAEVLVVVTRFNSLTRLYTFTDHVVMEFVSTVVIIRF